MQRKKKTSLLQLMGKLNKSFELKKHYLLGQWIPETRNYSFAELLALLNKYPTVFVKPNAGSLGRGVMRVEKHSTGLFTLRKDTSIWDNLNQSELSTLLHSFILQIPFVIQQGIESLTYNGSAMDFRVMVQLNENSVWECTGIMGRVAPKNKIVSNLWQGGKPMPFRELMSPYTPPEKLVELEALFKRIGVIAGEIVKRSNSFVHAVGVDIALDKHFTPWILEVNHVPDHLMFNQIADKSMFQRIMQLRNFNLIKRSFKRPIPAKKHIKKYPKGAVNKKRRRPALSTTYARIRQTKKRIKQARIKKRQR